MADDTSTIAPAAPSTDASPFTPMAEASVLGAQPGASSTDDTGEESPAVAIPINGKLADSTTPDTATPFVPTVMSSDTNTGNPIPMPPDMSSVPSAESAMASDATATVTVPVAGSSTQPAVADTSVADTATVTTADPTPVSDTSVAEATATPQAEAKVSDDELNDAVAKLEAQAAADIAAKPPVAPPAAPTQDASTGLASGPSSAAPFTPVASDAPKVDAPKAEVAKKTVMPGPMKSENNPRIREHIEKVTAPVETMIANAQKMDNKELVALLQKQKEALSQKAKEDFIRNDKLKSERLSKAATVISEILQIKSAGQKVAEQMLYEFSPATAQKNGLAEFPNSEMALETARAVYQLVGAKEPSDLEESDMDENGYKVATATRDTEIGVQLKEWVSLAADGTIAEMRISTVGEI